MPAYILLATVSALIPPQFLVQALDDDGDGVADEGLFPTILGAAQTKIDGILGQRFTTPFENPIPAIVADACLTIVCDTLFKRRSIEDDKNPWAKPAAASITKLTAIAKGEEPLEPGKARAQPSASIISEPAKTTSRSGRSAT
jgi:phage gp36-like protein